MMYEARNVSPKIVQPWNAATTSNGTRAIHTPILGMSSPKATITESGTANGTPSRRSATYMSAPTHTITITFARR